ncbi:MAG: PP2C family protein-serine/threonine phosphatase, partial [Oscillospiraceae bacterium]|nr:PP2C family protein-serine/threonine phosphatase [Oscillospiraceae bacterium]
IAGALGVVSFTNAFKKEYSTTTYHMADTATILVNGDHLEDYLQGLDPEEYERTNRSMDKYCQSINVSLIYVILVDTSDYGRFVSVFNLVNNSVDDTDYTPWELGHKRDTTNDEYRQKYKAIYEEQAPYETVYRTNVPDGMHPHITTMVPVKSSSGEVAAILCIQRPISELQEARRPYLMNVAVSTLFLAIVSSIFAALYIMDNIVTPIRRTSEEATRFAKENTKGEPLGVISRYGELQRLADSIDTMESDMVNYIDNLTTFTAEKERIVTELALASDIQENSVPSDFPAFPDRSDFDIYASMTPAKGVGGDFYNFFLLDEDHLVMLIGDVSGKGIPASLFMMVCNILICDRTQMGGTPAEILEFVNNNICEHNKADMFVTVWLGILEISSGRVTAANAGHEDAAICRKDGSFELYETRHGLVVGAMQGIKHKNFEFTLSPGDKLFLYTDGVPEATDSDNNMFTLERTVDALNRYREGTPKDILDGIRKSVDEFVGDAAQFDDLTMLCLELKEPGGEPSE